MWYMKMILNNQIVNKYIIELPEIIDMIPPKEELWSHRTGVLEENQRAWDGQTWYETDIEVQSLFNPKFIEPGTTIDPYLTIKHEGKWMRPHIDNAPGRLAVIIYPIIPNDYDIVYTDNMDWDMENQDTTFYESYDHKVPYDYNIIFRHKYRCPTMLNTKLPHAIEELRERRMLSFRINFGDSSWNFDDVVKLYKSGKMFNV